ncbi:multiheme c-type cytochrome [Geoglobus sp.]
MRRLLLALLIFAATIALASADDCIDCHRQVTPGIVEQWLSGNMSKHLGCEACHGIGHRGYDDWQNAKMPTPDTCKACHPKQYEQYASGKHYYAWIAMKAMPALQHVPNPQKSLEGFKGCSGCHKIGYIEGEEQYRYGAAACDSCHTRHKFSKEEARKPEACLPCHMGFDHPQYEMWSTSKHGVIYRIEGDTGRAPKCQTCHMSNGNHSVMTAWGFLALRVPEDDEEWWKDRVTILQALGVLDENGNPTERFDIVKAGKVARLSKEEWQAEREKMIETCSQCHSENFARKQLEAGDRMIREADRVFAEAIRTVKELYDLGILEKPEGWKYAPDLLQFYEVKTPIEEELYLMFMEYRMRTFQGAFHMNPDYSFWYGWAPLKESLIKIKYEAEKLKAEKLAEEKTAQPTSTPTPEKAEKQSESTPGFEAVSAAIAVLSAVALAARAARKR